MGMRVGVAGASGYAGGELLRLLLAHPDLEVGPITAASNAGVPVTQLHPQLRQLAGRAFTATEPGVLAEADLIFLALPHGASAALAAQLPSSVPVVDLGADHRLVEAGAWERYYGGAHAGAWTYGLPELPGARARISGAHRVANPGCYPTAVILALAPLLSAGLVEPDDIVVVASSGTSGAGRGASSRLLGSEVMGDVAAYKVGAHQHAPEVVQMLCRAAGTATTVSFTPVLAPLPRGMLATCTARSACRPEELRIALRAAYDNEPFVHVLADGEWPHAGATAGSNAAHLQVTVDGGRAVVVAAMDNLGKGAAGQAVQNANLMLGLAETAGLSTNGVAP